MTAALDDRRLSYSRSLLDSATKTATGNTQSTPVTLRDTAAGIVFQVDVTAAGSAVDDTLDVVIQTTFDGTNWVDVLACTQVLGNGGAKRFLGKISATEPQALFATATAISAGSVRHLIGDTWAVKWTIVAGAGTHSFTFSVTATPIGS